MTLLKNNLLQISLFIATVSTVGSLFFSEIMKLPPCVLCWYQRILMYPLIVIFAVGIWKKDKNIPFFALPLALIGTVIAFFHNLLYYGIIPESTVPCTLGISCTTKLIELYGFITIPLMSLIAFLVIDALMIAYYKLNKSSK